VRDWAAGRGPTARGVALMSSTTESEHPAAAGSRTAGRAGGRRRALRCVLPLLLAAIAATPAAPGGQPPAPGHDVQEELRRRFEAATIDPAALELDGERLHARAPLASFYERRGYLPVWTAGGALRPATLVEALRAAEREGLAPEQYHLQAIVSRLVAGSLDARAAVELELLTTDALLLYAAHLRSGRVDPTTLRTEPAALRREADLVGWLEGVVGGRDLAGAMGALLPSHPGYWGLRWALARYRALEEEGGWPEIPAGEVLDPGGDDPRVPDLRRRLTATGDLQESGVAVHEEAPVHPGAPGRGGGSDALDEDDRSALYDDSLVAAVRRFQKRHGLDADGRVGERTIAALNVPAAQRVRQIELNLERWRWLPRDLGERYLLVNIPSFELALVERERVLERMKVIVGRFYRRTPVFSDQVRYIVLNPRWDVPQSIALHDKLPAIRRDPTYLARMGMRVLSGWGDSEVEVDPATVDWEALGPGNIPYHLRQDPGPLNALGRVKFMFPNEFNVYLHDTPERELFARTDRDFSSGCIRAERALDLAVALLEPDGVTREQIEALLATGRETTRVLGTPVPVHVLYWTAFVEADGTVSFRRDLYQRDVALEAALAREQAGPSR
jgi:L,D-transpeptidase YcbB